MSEPARPYRQVARAAATEETRRRIVDGFHQALQAHWMEEITLDAVAAEAGTTRQTVIRLFGGKEGLLEAVADRTAEGVAARRALPRHPTPDAAARAVVEDYEAIGDMILRLLAQEGRYPLLGTMLNIGRREHRRWVAETFAAALAARPPAAAEALLDQLVVATDVFTWKLLRRDMGRLPAAVIHRVAGMIAGILNEGGNAHG